MKTKLPHLLLAFTLATGAALAAPQTFDFKDPKGVNNAVFKLDAPLEAVNGNATGISGTVTFDPAEADLATTRGRIVVASSSLHVGNPMQQQHLLSDKWLNAAKYPEISFEAKELKNAKTLKAVKTLGATTSADVTGTFTLKGISKEITVPVEFTYLKNKLGQRVPNQKGDLLVIRANFSIQRSDFGIMPGQMEEESLGHHRTDPQHRGRVTEVRPDNTHRKVSVVRTGTCFVQFHSTPTRSNGFPGFGILNWTPPKSAPMSSASSRLTSSIHMPVSKLNGGKGKPKSLSARQAGSSFRAIMWPLNSFPPAACQSAFQSR